MSSKWLDTISDFSRHGYTLRVDCRACKRLAIIDPLEITNAVSTAVMVEANRGGRTPVALLETRQP
tara:strand:- start:17620 stop:17817 length:198 start_codon:yes stop_codon:yes gene_type:complete